MRQICVDIQHGRLVHAQFAASEHLEAVADREGRVPVLHEGAGGVEELAVEDRFASGLVAEIDRGVVAQPDLDVFVEDPQGADGRDLMLDVEQAARFRWLAGDDKGRVLKVVLVVSVDETVGGGQLVRSVELERAGEVREVGRAVETEAPVLVAFLDEPERARAMHGRIFEIPAVP